MIKNNILKVKICGKIPYFCEKCAIVLLDCQKMMLGLILPSIYNAKLHSVHCLFSGARLKILRFSNK